MPCYLPTKRSSRISVRAQKGSVLLEVVLALALFIGAATVISTGINASVEAVRRVRLQTHAVNLAISVMSELQMGARPLAPIGPENFEEPFKEWLYRVNIGQAEEGMVDGEGDQSVRAVEVIVWHTEENAVHRITQFFRGGEVSAAEQTSGGAL